MQITKHEHVVPRESGWAVKVADGEKASKIFDNKEKAIEYAKELAKKHNVCMVVHDKKGKFKEFKCNPELLEELKMEKEECAPAGWHEGTMSDKDMESSDMMCIPTTFNKKMTVLDQHVIKKDNQWAVVTEGENIAYTFPNKAQAMRYAYDNAIKNDSCMLIHDENGKFKSIACPPDGNPGILEVVKNSKY